jgi:hypothetical protein
MLARLLDSLVRVSRRVVKGHYVKSAVRGMVRARTGRQDRQAVQTTSTRRSLADVPAGRHCRGTAQTIKHRIMPPFWAPCPAATTSLDSKTKIAPCPNISLYRFPFNNFTHCLTPFSRCFSSFPHGTCSLSVSCLYLALDEIYHRL